MKYTKLICLLLLAFLGVACGGTTTPATTATTVDETADVTVKIVGTDTGFQARSLDGIASFRVVSSGGQAVELDRDPDQPTLTLFLKNLPDGSDTFIVEALDEAGEVVAHYRFFTSIPGNVIVHVDRFTLGAPQAEGAVGEFVEQYRFPVFGNSDLTETYWNVAVDVAPPFVRSDYDIIGLHRVVGDNPRPGRVLLFLPGAQCNGSLYTLDERRDFRLYLANRGYDVYSLDYRIHFAPPYNIAGVDLPGVVTPDLRFMAAWNAAAFVSDVHTAIGFIKQTSQVDKIFLSGFSSGGQVTYFYACSEQDGRLGQEDLRGIITMDGGPFQQGTKQPPDTLSAQVARDALLGGDTPRNRAIAEEYGSDPGPGYYSGSFGDLSSDPFLANLLDWLVDENAPSPSNPGETAADFIINRFQNNWGLNPDGDGQFTNIARGYNSLPTLLAWSVLAADNYWPLAFTFDDAVTTNFSGPADGPYRVPVNAGGGLHYLDNLGKVTVPQFILGTGGLTSYLGNKMAWKFQGIALSSSTDTEQHILEHFGHLDTLSGTKSNEFVARPMLEWLDKH